MPAEKDDVGNKRKMTQFALNSRARSPGGRVHLSCRSGAQDAAKSRQSEAHSLSIGLGGLCAHSEGESSPSSPRARPTTSPPT